MKRKIFKWAIKISVAAILLLGLLVVIVLTPSLMYANKTSAGSFTVYHNKPLDKELKLRLDDATEILKASEFYNANIKFDICMNDGSFYPLLLQAFLGKAFALGFTSNKVVLCGDVNVKENYVQVNDYKWNLTQLLAHEETHCLVFHKFGFWKSNPVANHPDWKWEGYPEYISRRAADQTDLAKNIEQLNTAIRNNKDEWGISLADSTLSSRKYFHYRLLIQYCLDIKKNDLRKFNEGYCQRTNNHNTNDELVYSTKKELVTNGKILCSKNRKSLFQPCENFGHMNANLPPSLVLSPTTIVMSDNIGDG